LSTDRLSALCASVPVLMVRACLDAPESALDTRVAVARLVPISPRATLTVTARCVWVWGPNSLWSVEAHDVTGLVGVGSVEVGAARVGAAGVDTARAHSQMVKASAMAKTL
jgi:hypothetical protein